MQTFNFPIKKKARVLSLGAESAGRFAFYKNGNIFVSENFGDLLDENNFSKFKKEVLKYVKKEKPSIILTDLHPLYNSTIFGQELSQKLKIPRLKVQHHIAHIFSAVGDRLIIQNSKLVLEKHRGFKTCPREASGIQNLSSRSIGDSKFIGIAADGTGYGLDGNIWGGEVFQIENVKIKMENDRLKSKNNLSEKIKIRRIGSLEEQVMIGGDLAVKEPARMLIAIMAKLKTKNEKLKTNDHKIIKTKNDIYHYVKKYYTRNEFEALYNQLQQNFNCQITTSAGRVLDAASLLLGFADNKRDFKHEAIKLLEKNSTIPYNDIKLRITNHESRILNNNPQVSSFQFPVPNPKLPITNYQLPITILFEYLLKNINKDKMRLAATAQEYIARGFYEMVKENKLNTKYYMLNTYFAGGMANNKIMSAYLEKRNVYVSQKIPRGDEGIAFGQIVRFLVN